MLYQNIVYVEYMNDEIMFMLKNCDHWNNKCWIMVYVEMNYVQICVDELMYIEIFTCRIQAWWKLCMLNHDFAERSTEIIDTEDGKGSLTKASHMNSRRSAHGMGVVTIKGEDRLAVFGGRDGNNYLDSVELYNTQTEKWETTDIKLKDAKSYFGFLSVKLSDVILHLWRLCIFWERALNKCHSYWSK